MLQILRFSLLVAAVGLLLAGPAAASHLQGGDLTYAALGNHRYRVTAHVYRDCSVIALSGLILQCRTSGCNAPVAVSAPMVQVGGATTGRQYCATLSGICTATGPANSEAYTFTADVTLPPAARWTLSTVQTARPGTANLVGAGNLYLEATLSNLVAGAGTAGVAIANNSPVASALPVSYVPAFRLSTLSNNAFDVDGDSLAYTLETPLEDCGTSAAYAAYPGSPVVVLSTTPACVAQLATSATYSAALPMYVAFDTAGTCPIKTGTPRFAFDARTGTIQLQPARYVPSASALGTGDNKYAAVVKITEYRRFSGRMLEVGSVRRELYFMVYDGGPNLLPRLAAAVTVQLGTRVTVQPLGQEIPVVLGEPVAVLLTATDPNPAQVPTFTLNYNAMPGTALQNLGGGQARVTFTPPLTLLPGLYRVAVTAEDNTCPIKGLETQLLTFRVMAAPLAARARTGLALAAYPNPFTNEVQFRLATPGLQTLTICDNLGRPVATVRSQPDGTVRWLPGTTTPAGLYLARTADGRQTVRLLRTAAH